MTTTARPEFPRDMFPDWPDDGYEEFLDEMNQGLDALEERGPVTITFPEEHTEGAYFWQDLSKFESTEDESAPNEARPRGGMETFEGVKHHDTYVEFAQVRVAHPSVEFVQAFPFEYFSWVDIAGLSDEAFCALVARPKVTSLLNVSCVVTQSDVDAARASEEELPPEERDPQPFPATVGGTPLSSKAYGTAARRTGLTALCVRGTAVDDDTMRETVSALPSLEWFGLSSEVATFSDLSFMPESLVVLDIGGPRFDIAGLSTLPVLPNLGAVVVHGPGVADLDPQVLRRAAPALQTLRMIDENGRPLDIGETLRVRLAFPGIEINDVAVSEKGLRRAALKAGIDPDQI